MNLRCQIIRQLDGRSTGMAHVDFDDEENAYKAFQEYNNMTLDGREMRIVLIRYFFHNLPEMLI